MPIDDASIAQLEKPRAAKSASAFCRVIGSGVVRPVDVSAGTSSSAEAPPVAAARGGSPMPRVPITAERRPSAPSACATHQAVEVLPLVPVTAMTSSFSLGAPRKRLAMSPAAAFRPRIAATRGSPSKPRPAAPSASTRQATAPARSASGTCRRPSLA